MNQEAAMIYLRKGKTENDKAIDNAIVEIDALSAKQAAKHHPNECQRKRSLGQLVKSAAVVLLIGALAAFTVWYVGYLIYEAVQ